MNHELVGVMKKNSWASRCRRLFLILWAAVFSLLLIIQCFFAIFPQYQKEQRAERLGAEIRSDLDTVIAAAESYSGLDAYFTLETDKGVPSSAELLLNGVSVGTFENGILGFRAAEGDTLEIRGGARGLIVSMVDPPENLADGVETEVTLSGGSRTVFWGRIAFQ